MKLNNKFKYRRKVANHSNYSLLCSFLRLVTKPAAKSGIKKSEIFGIKKQSHFKSLLLIDEVLWVSKSYLVSPKIKGRVFKVRVAVPSLSFTVTVTSTLLLSVASNPAGVIMEKIKIRSSESTNAHGGVMMVLSPKLTVVV
jgi:hypothetical protein